MRPARGRARGLPEAPLDRWMLDYRWGWRWLVPLAGAVGLRAVDIHPVDAAFLREALGLRDDAPDRHAVAIVDADGGAAPASASAAYTVCVLGREHAVKRWRAHLRATHRSVTDYALLPASAPRVVVPLASARAARAGLELHRPSRASARMAVALARALLHLGVDTPLRGRVLCVATRGDPRPCGAVACDLRHLADERQSALYLGFPGPARKTVVLPVGDDEPPCIVKVAQSPGARRALSAEIAALRSLARTPLGPRVPRCLGVDEGAQTFAVREEYRRRRRAHPRALGRSALEFLVALSRIDRGEAPLAKLLDDLACGGEPPPEASALVHRLRRDAAAGTRVVTHRVHGDLAPWNCAWTSSGFFVFDWEEPVPQAPALGDAFYLSLARAMWVGSWRSARTLLRQALALGARVAAAAELHVDVRLHFALWLLRSCVTRPSPLDGALFDALEGEWRRA